MKTKLFFSGIAKPGGALISFCENAGWELTQQPLIRFEKLLFTLPENFDVVLFPLAKNSNETIVKNIPDNQKMIVRCYETILVEKTLNQHDTYVFTSPSNVTSFLKSNTFPEKAKLIAWGTTTAAKMREFGLEPIARIL